MDIVDVVELADIDDDDDDDDDELDSTTRSSAHNHRRQRARPGPTSRLHAHAARRRGCRAMISSNEARRRATATASLKLRGLHDEDDVAAKHRLRQGPSSSLLRPLARRAPSIASDGGEEGGRTTFFHLPAELQIDVLTRCDYFTLKRVQRVCRRLYVLLDEPAFDAALFRCRSPQSLASAEELKARYVHVLARHHARPSPRDEEGGTSNLLYTAAVPHFEHAVQVHPAIEQAVLPVDATWQDVVLVVGQAFPRHLRIADLAPTTRHESATSPPVNVLSLLLKCPAHADFPYDRWFGRWLPRGRMPDEQALTVEDVLTEFVILLNTWRGTYNLDTQEQQDAFRQRYAHRTCAEGPFVRIDAAGYVELEVQLNMT